MQTVHISPKRAAAFRVGAGESFAVVDPEGGQVADLVAFDGKEVTDRFSTKYTMRQAGRLRVSTGDSLYTTSGDPLLSIVDDDCGVHDLLFAPCNRWILDEYGQTGERGCHENLSAVLEAFDVPSELVYDPMNVFMHTTVTDNEYVDVREPVSSPGDAVRFTADRGAVVAVSACAPEATVNAGSASPIELRLPAGATTETNF
ncbi:MAG: DUF1989 domain-containing protein [Halolamina sp.]